MDISSEIVNSLLKVFRNDEQDALSLPLPTCGSVSNIFRNDESFEKLFATNFSRRL